MCGIIQRKTRRYYLTIAGLWEWTVTLDHGIGALEAVGTIRKCLGHGYTLHDMPAAGSQEYATLPEAFTGMVDRYEKVLVWEAREEAKARCDVNF